MMKKFLAFVTALVLAVIAFTPAMGFTISSEARTNSTINSERVNYTIGSGTLAQVAIYREETVEHHTTYSIGSKAVPYSIKLGAIGKYSNKAGTNATKIEVLGGQKASVLGTSESIGKGLEVSAVNTTPEDVTAPAVTKFSIKGAVKDENQTHLVGWKIYLEQPSNTAIANTTTSKNGSYLFAGLKPGAYAVAEALPVDWSAVTPAGGKVNLALVDKDVTVDFVNTKIVIEVDESEGNETRATPADQGAKNLFETPDKFKDNASANKSTPLVPSISNRTTYQINRTSKGNNELLYFNNNTSTLQTAKDWTNRGWALYNARQYNESIKAFNKAIEINPKLADAWNGKGAALNDQRKYNESAKAFSNATKLDPSIAGFWYSKGWALYNARQYNESINAFDKAIEINPKLADAWNGKGAALNDQRKYNESAKAYSYATKLDPSVAGFWYSKGWALYNARQYNESINAFNKAIEINPKLADAWNGKGAALEALNRNQEADTAITEAKKIK